MIKGIEKIANFGVFNNYTKPPGIQDFADKNIIYGWNYSGKTMLSRLFWCLEHQCHHPDFTDAQFRIIDSSGNQITQSSVGAYGNNVRVFNAEFTERNLSWDGETFDPILLLGEDSIEAKKLMAENEKIIERCREAYASKGRKIQSVENTISEKKTAKGKQIKQNLSLIETFTAAHINSLLPIIEIDPKKFLLEDSEVSLLLKKALASEDEKLDQVTPINVLLKLDGLNNRVESELNRKPELSNTIEYLENDSNLANWIEHGLEIHDGKSECEFCGNQLNKDRITNFKAHFSEDLENFKNVINELLVEAKQSKISIIIFNKRQFHPEFQDDLRKIQANIGNSIEKYNNRVDILVKVLDKKIEAPFTGISIKPISDDILSSLQNSVSSLNALIEDSNKVSNSFGSGKVEAIRDLKHHYISELIFEIPLAEKKRLKKILSRQRTWFESKEQTLKKENQVLEAEISLAQKGREEINRYISGFLGRDEVQIDVVKVGDLEQFRLVREGEIAKNLSEGEKTAIAFSFFLTKLLELDELEKAIIYIDDPISSLDSNHIFQVNAALKEVFCYHDSSAGNEWKLRCKQLFISTHNFEFFTLLRELPPRKKARCRFFFVKRINTKESTLVDLPDSIKKYSSEYHYLFSVIHRFQNSDNKQDLELLLAIPNALRRFLELYTYAKIPDDLNSTVDQRAEKIFGAEKSKRILKVLHYFSHLNSIERISKNSDLISDIDNVVNDVIEHLKTDNLHYEALLKAL